MHRDDVEMFQAALVIVPFCAKAAHSCQVLINCRNNRNWLVVSNMFLFHAQNMDDGWSEIEEQIWADVLCFESIGVIFAYESMTSQCSLVQFLWHFFCLLVSSWKCRCFLFESQPQARFWRAWKPLTVIPTWSWRMCGRCGQKSLTVARKRPSQWTRTEGGGSRWFWGGSLEPSWAPRKGTVDRGFNTISTNIISPFSPKSLNKELPCRPRFVMLCIILLSGED